MELNEALVDLIKNLRDDLDQAHQTIVDLMPEDIQKLLNGYYHCQSESDTYSWQRDVIEQIIQKAIPLQPHSNYSSDRAYCPLCGRGSSSGYENGFALPDGLSRHLRGDGNNRQCDVMAAAQALARDYWKTQSSKWKEIEEIHINKRRATEPLFVTSYKGNPQFIDEGHSWEPARTPESLVWAENRLVEIGFSLHSEEHTKTYTLERDNFLIFADPRTVGHIDFLIYKKPLTESGRRLSTGDFPHLRVNDSWKHDLRGKFERRFTELTSHSQ